jgi:hypothetical protein
MVDRAIGHGEINHLHSRREIEKEVQEKENGAEERVLRIAASRFSGSRRRRDR